MRLQNELKLARSNSTEISPEQIIKSMEEKTQVDELIDLKGSLKKTG